MSASIQVKNVRKVYWQSSAKPGWHRLVGKQAAPTKFTALNKLSVNIKPGSFTTIFGPNGSGKSTLFRLIAGLDEPTSGELSVDGKPVSKAKIGFVFQNYRDSMLTWRTALGNVRLPLESKGLKASEQDKIALKHLNRVGMGHLANKPFYSLSGGQAQLVAIARAFVYEPDILLMDEPFSALDFQTSMSMMQILTKVWQETKITTLFISHDIDEAVFLADQVIVLTKNPGRVQKIVPVNLPRPRNVSLISDAEFFTIRSKVLEEFEKGSKK